MQEGDLSYSYGKAGVQVLKILRVSSDQNTYHCLVFKPVSTPPKLEDIPKLEVFVWHAPIDATSFNENNTHIGNIAVTPNELLGYLEYLKHTDFKLYIQETHQDLESVLNRADAHYKRGCALHGTDAIAEYTAALEIYPLHYFALDNRGFTFMEVGDLQSAMKDFEASLHIHPSNIAALFSLGECHFKLGNYKTALEYFESAQKVEPRNLTVLEWLARTRVKIKNHES